MLAMIPQKAIMLSIALIVIGILGGMPVFSFWEKDEDNYYLAPVGLYSWQHVLPGGAPSDKPLVVGSIPIALNWLP